MLKKFLLIFAFSLPMLSWAESPNRIATYKSQSIWFYSDFYVYQADGFDEIRYAYIDLIEDPMDGLLDVTVQEGCLPDIGTCDTLTRSLCIVEDLEPAGIKTLKTSISIELQSEDCVVSLDFDGVLFNAVFNNEVWGRTKYESHFGHVKDPDSKANCIYYSKDGVLEDRFADVEMLISETQLVGKAYIQTLTSPFLIETCPEE